MIHDPALLLNKTMAEGLLRVMQPNPIREVLIFLLVSPPFSLANSIEARIPLLDV